MFVCVFLWLVCVGDGMKYVSHDGGALCGAAVVEHESYAGEGKDEAGDLKHEMVRGESVFASHGGNENEL